jgi:hypothetical protein
MDNTDKNKNINQALGAFEAMNDLTPSDHWDESLMRKLQATQRKKKLKPSYILFIVFTLLVLGGNVVYGVKMLSTDVDRSDQDSRLEAVSKAFLINPESVKN